MSKMKIGTVVLCQMDITPDNGEPVILLGTFGIITDMWGIGGYMVQFADHETPLSVSGNYITPLGNDNWNDHLLRNEMRIKRLEGDRKNLNAALSFFLNMGEWKTIFVGNRMNRKTITLSDESLEEFRKLVQETNS